MQVIDWQLIVKKHGPAVWYTAYKLVGNSADAADCFQETFVSALEVSRRQRVRSFSALLVRLATVRAIDRLRQRSRQPRLGTDAADVAVVVCNNPGPFQEVQRRELAGKLREALGRLPPQEAEVFSLRYLSDMSYRQIGKELGIKTNTAGVMLHRARTKLRELMESDGKEKGEV
ncbi:MAG: RNA polymerase sigma factor [Planctomycetota bacterium]